MAAYDPAPPTGRPPSRLRSAWAAAPVTLGLIAVNVVIWLALTFAPQSGALANLLALSPTGICALNGSEYVGVPAARCTGSGGAYFPGVHEGGLWQLLTSAFTHLEPAHLGFNMLALWFLGPQLERFLGGARYLALYLLSALAGSAAVYWLTEPAQATVGASGAVFGLMGALLIIAWRRGGRIQELLGWIGANVVFTVLGGPQISWQGHLGGFLGGVAVAALLMGLRPAKKDASGWVFLGVALALAALIALRSLTFGAA